MSATTSAKERPILFKGEMVRAILDGSKTQTRRVVKRQGDMEFDVNDPFYGPYWLSYATEADGEDAKVRCPYGKPTERLWVRETHRYWFPDWIDSPAYPCRCRYKADDSLVELAVEWEENLQFSTPQDVGLDVESTKWRPSIFMPRWASRITLEITATRVERLQSISETDARAEGVKLRQRAVSPSEAQGFWWDYLRSEPGYRWARESFASLWESINGPGSWEANPWVWVVEFSRVQP
jgi:hypothetical protein